MTIGSAPICVDCVHFIKGDGNPGLRCKAFTDGIPDEIIFGEADHHKPFKGDNGIRFEPIPKAPNERKST